MLLLLSVGQGSSGSRQNHQMFQLRPARASVWASSPEDCQKPTEVPGTTISSISYKNSRCKDAGGCLQGMRELIQNFSVVDMKGIFLQYATKVSRELPFLHRLQPQQLAEPPNNKGLNNGSKGNIPDIPRVS